MKAFRFSTIAAVSAAASLTVMTACEYDVAQPLWYQDFTEPPHPKSPEVWTVYQVDAGIAAASRQ